MRIKNLPINVSNFKKMIEENRVYVDKTDILYDLLEVKQERFLFLSRPRRFGKSLMVSTLAELFSGNKELFKDLWIGKNNDYGWQEYPVIQFDFSNLPAKTDAQFEASLTEAIEAIAKQNGIDLSSSSLLNGKLLQLINELSKENRVAILIDEYDHPLLANINRQETAEAIREIMKGFFTTIKSCDTKGQIHAIFVTGVTKFSKTSLFSGFNNLSDMSLRPEAAALLGYTQQELRHYFAEYVEQFAQKQGVSPEDIFASLKEWYNGYRFSEDEITVYNPYSIIYVLATQKFSNYWLSSGTPSFLINLLQTRYYDIETMNNARLSAKALDVFEIGKIPLLPILFQAGYLTITQYHKAEDNYTLGFPNGEVRDAFDWYILSALSAMDAAHSEMTMQKLKKALEENNMALFCQTLKIMLAEIPFDLHLRYEAYYHSLMQVIINLLGFAHHSEVHTSNGIIDMTIDTPKRLYIFELKFKDSAQMAINQIKGKRYYEKFVALNKPITLVGLSFKMNNKELTVDSVQEDFK